MGSQELRSCPRGSHVSQGTVSSCVVCKCMGGGLGDVVGGCPPRRCLHHSPHSHPGRARAPSPVPGELCTDFGHRESWCLLFPKTSQGQRPACSSPLPQLLLAQPESQQVYLYSQCKCMHGMLWAASNATHDSHYFSQ